jgi:hypothetical protein
MRDFLFLEITAVGRQRKSYLAGLADKDALIRKRRYSGRHCGYCAAKYFRWNGFLYIAASTIGSATP